MIQLIPGALHDVKLLRGPSLSQPDLSLSSGQSASLWLYNFEPQPLKVHWRIIAGAESVCGFDSSGQPRTADCNSPDTWPEATLGPERSDSLTFAAPDSWFSLFERSTDFRDSQLEVRFGDDAAATLQRIPFKLSLQHSWLPLISFSSRFLRVIFWVTFGAALLMLAQVMIPNFRSCLTMESQADSFAEDLRAVDSTVGSRTFSRCQQELNALRRGLAMRQDGDVSNRWKFFKHSPRHVWLRLALSGNTAEVTRLQNVFPKMESRIRLTQRLVQEISALLPDMPVTLYWDRNKKILAVQDILSGQIMTEADEKNAADLLDLLAKDFDSVMKDFAEQLEKRIAAIRQQFKSDPWKTRGQSLAATLPGCNDLLQSTPGDTETSTRDQLIFRDICAVRLELLIQFVGLESLIPPTNLSDEILEKLKSTAPLRLASARCDLLSVSEGVFEKDIVDDLEAGLWDSEWEPVDPTHQDVIRMSLQLRNSQKNQATAKSLLKCSWLIKTANDEYYEEDWESRFLLPPGNNTVLPYVLDHAGNEVKLCVIDPETKKLKPKEPIAVDVRDQKSGTVGSRAVRGLIDASITALVPVITVAFTQFQNGGDITILKLILLGFTSQAIRSAVLPDGGSVSAPLPVTKTTTATST